jgi:tripartite-type tricarboxylate transporter receptor subunit TctC
MTKRTFATVLGAIVALVLTCCAISAQQTWPARPVRLVVGYGAGGAVDMPARFIAEKLSAALGQRVFVENKAGAAGMLAARDVLSQPPDGHTLLLCSHFESLNTVFHKNAGFKLSDVAPVSLIVKYYYALSFANSLPPRTLAEFVAYGRSHPGEINYATLGSGSAQEIMARQLAEVAGIEMTRIPFRGGPEIAQEMVAGRVHFYVAPTLTIMPQYEAKQLKVLAVSSPERLASFPGVPTLKESGFDFVRFGWLGICVRSGTDHAIIARLNSVVAAVVATPEYRKLVEGGGYLAVSSSPEELQAVLTETAADGQAAVQKYNLQVED